MNLFDYFFNESVNGGSGSGEISINSNGLYNVKFYATAKVDVSIPVAKDSLTPVEFGVDANGFYIANAAGEGNAFSFGRDSSGIYAVQEVSNE